MGLSSGECGTCVVWHAGEWLLEFFYGWSVLLGEWCECVKVHLVDMCGVVSEYGPEVLFVPSRECVPEGFFGVWVGSFIMWVVAPPHDSVYSEFAYGLCVAWGWEARSDPTVLLKVV